MSERHEKEAETPESDVDGVNHLQRSPSQTSDEEKENKIDTPTVRTVSNASVFPTFSPLHEFTFVTLICCVQLTTQASLGQTLILLPTIGEHFGLKGPALSWLIAGYSLTVGTFILAAGRFGDVFGYKRMLLIGYLWFAFWTMVTGLSYYSNHVLFIFGRVLAGIGPAICMPNGLAILGASYPPGGKKAMAFSFFGACAPSGCILGATFAGIFVEFATWPWAYYSFAIALAGIAALCVVVIPNPPHKEVGGSLQDKLKELDVVGACIGILALVLFNFAWNQAPIVGWQEPYVIVALILGVLVVPAFFHYELRVATTPIIPFPALTTDVAFVLVCVACGWACFGIWIYYLFSFFANLRHGSPLLVSAWSSPTTVSGLCASVTTGFLLTRVRPAWVMLIALTAFLIGVILIGTCPVDQIYWGQSFFSTIVSPWGMDMSFPAATLILSNSVPRKHQGIAASLVATVVNYSISLGLGFAGTVEVHVGGADDILKGYRGAWYMGMGLSGLGVATSALFVARSYWLDAHPKGGVSDVESGEELGEEEREKEEERSP